MRLGYFGGTFDPPHLGHLAAARAAADVFALDRILFVPTASQPLKPGGAVASYADRLAMVTLLCKADSRCEASGLEAPSASLAPHYTIDTLIRLTSAEPSAEVYVIVGADAFHDLPSWRSPDQLLSIADWIVLTRPHHAAVDLPPLTPTQRERVHLLAEFDHPASATAIRAELARDSQASDEALAQQLPPSVLAYIRAHHLYE